MHEEICLKFPAIAGVAIGALVLRDQGFSDMDLETFQMVVKPKVDGTLFLSELFQENTLDFFIAFSSVVATLGNNGQSAYSAANSFTKTLVNQRRERGLAGSVIDSEHFLICPLPFFFLVVTDLTTVHSLTSFRGWICGARSKNISLVREATEEVDGR